METLVFLFKIAVPPVLVAGMSLAARRWGPTFAGLILGLPWMTGPILFFLAADKGLDYAIETCTGIALGVPGIALFVMAWALTARLAPWPLSLMAAVLAFAGSGGVTRGLELPLWLAAAGAFASLLAAFALMPRARGPVEPHALPWWDLPARVAATATLVAIIMLLADVLGPRLSGIISTYPVILSVVASFTHGQSGPDAVLRLLRALMLSLLGFVAFFLVVGYGMPRLGLLPAFALAAATCITSSGVLVAVNRRRR